MKYSNQLIETVLSEHKQLLGSDYAKYRNHVYRVFLFCQLLDNSKENIDKYAIASVFHDIGIWTNKTFDYLEPSIDAAISYLNQNHIDQWQSEIILMINMHHKRSRYKGDHYQIVETFRKADWIDLTRGRFFFDADKNRIKSIQSEFPSLGFYRFLIWQTIKNFFKNPGNPLPMIKK